MAIAFDAASGNSGTGGTVTVSHTISGSNTILFCAVSNFSGADDITAVTYNGTSMTLVSKKGFTTLASPTNYTYLYYLINPTTGTNTLSVTRSLASSSLFIRASSYTGAQQSGVPDASGVGGADPTTTSVATSVTTIADNCWTVLAVGSQRNITAGTNTTLRNGSASNSAIGDSNSAITPAGSYSMTVTINGGTPDGGNYTGTVMASFAPFVAAAATKNLTLLGVG